jgi:hypothetical protein
MDEHLDQWMEGYINLGYGSILDVLNAEDQYAEEYPDLDLPWDEILAQQELEGDLGLYGGDEEW